MASADPLNLLRAALTAGTPPELLDASSSPSPLQSATQIRFPSSSPLPLSAPTRFTARESDASERYTLQQLYYVYAERETGGAEYMRKAAGMSSGMKVVSIVDRRLVLDYLEGKSEAPKGRVLVEGSDPADRHFEGAAPQGPVRSATDAAAAPSAAPASVKSTIGVGYVKRKYEVNEADREAVKKIKAQEISLLDRNDSLRCAPGGKRNDFSAFRRSVNDGQIKPLRAYLMELAKSGDEKAAQGAATAVARRPTSAVSSAGSMSGASTPRSSTSTDSRGKGKRAPQNNIIIISSSPTSLISMWNVKRFLEEGVYESNEEAKLRQQAEGNRKMEDVIVVYRKIQGPDGQTRNSKYLVIENVDALQKLGSSSGDDVWDRILCVFTTGQTWQFRPYKWQEPRELFRHVRGVYLHFSNEVPSQAVRDWKVTTLQIDPFKRHTDRQVVTKFWHVMDSANQR